MPSGTPGAGTRFLPWFSERMNFPSRKRMNLSSQNLALLAATSLLIPSAIAGQQRPVGTEVVERVVAVVGDSVILHTELEEFLIGMIARGWTAPEEPGALLEARLGILDQLINQQLILQEAAKDTLLKISEDELEDRVQEEIDGQIRSFGTLGRLQDALAQQSMTMAVFREQRKNLIRRQLLQERYFAKRGQEAADIAVTEEEARVYWEENQDLIPERPATVRFANIQVLPEPSEAAKAEALAEADSVLELIRGGEEFAELAERFSDGPTSTAGGELGWARRDGSFVPAFEEAAFALLPGSVSIPVETEFGYHLILVERVRGGERRLRHILIQPDITDADVVANDTRAESFAARLRAGETMVDLGMDPDTADLTLEQIAQTSQEFAAAMQDAEIGDVVGPIRLNDPRTPNGWGLAVLVGKTAGGAAEYFEFRDVIVERLRNQGLTETVIEGLRSQAYIDIRLGES